MADEEQWVNVKKDAKWVEDEVTSIHRLDHLHFQCEFENAQIANFKVRVIPRGSQAKYAKKEMKRNKKFKLRFHKFPATNKGGTLVKLHEDVSLPAAGGYRYLVEAKYKDKVVESTKIVVSRRRLFYQNTAMTGLAHGSVADMETEYWAPRNYWIKLKQKASNTMTFMKTLYDDDGTGIGNSDDFLKECKKSWTLEPRMPYAFMLVWVNYIADGGTLEIDQEVAYTIPSKFWTWSWSAGSFTIELGEYLWHGLVDAHDTAQHWLESIDVDFEDKAGTPTRLTIPKTQVTPDGGPDFAYGGYHKVKVDVSSPELAGLRNRFTKNEGKLIFKIKLRTVKSWTNGFSYNAINVITTARKAVWRDQTPAVEQYTLNHEFGHKIGMVADGVGRAPDKPSKHYTGQQHKGNHCSNGANYNAVTGDWSGAPGCVMFGADGVWDGTPPVLKSAPPTFCGICEPIVRKLDISEGMPGFAKTPNNF
jgi:hypothetical protein